MDHRNVIDNNLEDLVKSIEVRNTTLWERLVQLGLFKSDNVEYIKVSTIHFKPLRGKIIMISYQISQITMNI